MKIRVVATMCQGHGACKVACPELFELSDVDGHAIVLSEEVSPGLEAQARLARDACPEFAVRVSGGAGGDPATDGPVTGASAT